MWKLWSLAWLSSCAMLTSVAEGRAVPYLSYDQLWEKSELVLIVRAISTRDATGEDFVVPEKWGEDILTAVVTRFKVLAALKGEHTNQEFELSHFRLDEEKMKAQGLRGIINGPNLVEFETGKKRDTTDVSSMSVECDYLLFLKANSAGQFVCVTGQIDPKFSVRQIHPPLPTDRRIK